MYHLPRVCYALVPEIRVHPEILCIFRYIDVRTCVIYNCIRLITNSKRLKIGARLVSAVKIIDEDR